MGWSSLSEAPSQAARALKGIFHRRFVTIAIVPERRTGVPEKKDAQLLHAAGLTLTA
jgi:hypothetical protein